MPKRWYRAPSAIFRGPDFIAGYGGSTMVVKDLATKKQVTVHITPDAQMRRLAGADGAVLAARSEGQERLRRVAAEQARSQASGAQGSGPAERQRRRGS